MAFGKIELRDKRGKDGGVEGVLMIGPMRICSQQEAEASGCIAAGEVVCHDQIPGAPLMKKDGYMGLSVREDFYFELKMEGQVICRPEEKKLQSGVVMLTGKGVDGWNCRFDIWPLKEGGKWYEEGWRYRVVAVFDLPEGYEEQYEKAAQKEAGLGFLAQMNQGKAPQVQVRQVEQTPFGDGSPF